MAVAPIGQPAKNITDETVLEDLTLLVRNYLQDHPDKNALLEDEEEYSDTLLRMNILMALDLFNNAVGNITQYTLSNMPVPTLLIIGAAGLSLTSGGILQVRNHFTISDGGLGGPISEKSEYYKSWGQTLLDLFNRMSAKFKSASNMESGYSSISSSYLYTFADAMRGK